MGLDDDVAVLDTVLGAGLRVDAAPDNDRVNLRLDAASERPRHLIVGGPDAHRDRPGPDALDQVHHHVLLLPGENPVVEVVLEEGRVHVVAALLRGQVDKALSPSTMRVAMNVSQSTAVGSGTLQGHFGDTSGTRVAC